MKTILSIVLIASFSLFSFGQDNLYFPPLTSPDWKTTSFEELKWCEEGVTPLFDILEENDTKAFLLLKDGKIVIEKYFDGFKQDSSWVWFSAAKSLTSFLVGQAQEDGFLSIGESSNTYLGEGWTSLPPAQESQIKILNHLSLNTGLDYTVDDNFCTDPSCFQYLNSPGEHWYYHNATYSVIPDILENATGKTINLYTFQKLHQKIGMGGFWLKSGFLNLYFSTARSMARFGLVMLNNGDWNNEVIMKDKSYFNAMISSSQEDNPSYGYLWWLNGQSSYKLPGSDISFPGTIEEGFPSDSYYAIGAESQLLIVIPSQNIIIVRMGLEPGQNLVPTNILKLIGANLKGIICTSTSTEEQNINKAFALSPNPSSHNGFTISSRLSFNRYAIFDVSGKQILEASTNKNQIIKPNLNPGMYIIQIYMNEQLLDAQKIEIF